MSGGPGGKRVRLIVGVALIGGAIGWVATRGLAGNLVYFRTPTEVVTEATAGDRMRVGGQVVPGSVDEGTESTRFLVTDGTTRLTVVATAGLPALFRPGQGVVLEGIYGHDGAFRADNVLVKHDSVYEAPEPGETPNTAKVRGGALGRLTEVEG